MSGLEAIAITITTFAALATLDRLGARLRGDDAPAGTDTPPDPGSSLSGPLSRPSVDA